MMPTYQDLFTRNIGFVDENEQMLLRTAHVAVLGVGGMGGVVAQLLARAGVGKLTLLDKDSFEPSNTNRQVYARRDTWGQDKVAVTARELQLLNSELQLRCFDHFGDDNVAAVLDDVDIVVNGMDELAACLRLWRGAASRCMPLVDAWSAPLPNVFVVQPGEPSPEELLQYPSRGIPIDTLTDAVVDACRLREALHVALHSRSLRHLDLHIVAEIMSGKRARISFAPMVWGAANLMAWEVIKLRLGRGDIAPPSGIFWDPWRGDLRPARPFARWQRPLMEPALRFIAGRKA